MITGYNQDVGFEGLVFHVQTEDKGRDNPLIETLIYRGGEILGSRRLKYADLVADVADPEKEIARLMEEQHLEMIQEVKRGRFDLSLDQIVLDYLKVRFGSARA